MELLFRFIRRIWQLCQETLGTARTSSPRYLARTWPALSSLVPLGGRRMKFLSSCCGGRCHHLMRRSRSPSSWLRGGSSPVRSSLGTNTSRPCESQTDVKISFIILERCRKNSDKLFFRHQPLETYRLLELHGVSLYE